MYVGAALFLFAKISVFRGEFSSLSYCFNGTRNALAC